MCGSGVRVRVWVMPILRFLLAILVSLTALACAASAAYAGALTLNASVQGGGQITATSGGTYDCDRRSQELETDASDCDVAFFNAVFSVSLTLKAVPQAGWKRASWEGCDSINDKGECVLTGPIASRGHKTVKVVFDDIEGPAVIWDLQRHNPDSTIDLAWHTDEPATFKCGVRVDLAKDCTSPYHTHILAQNNYGWDILATDRNGSTTHAKSRVFTDVQSAISSAPSGRTNKTDATIAFGSPGFVDGYECKLDNGSWAACSSPWNIGGLAQGAHQVQVRGYRNGSYEIEPSTASWVVDTTVPQTTITAGPNAGTQLPVNTANIWIASTEAGTFQCRLDGAAWGPCLSNQKYEALPDGAHTFEARAVDEAGNVDPTPETRSWSVDTTPSVTTFAAAPSSGSTVASRDAEFVFNAPDNATFSCKLDDRPWAACTSPWRIGGLTDGQHVVQVRSTDDAGHVEAPAKTITWTVDTTAPATAFVSGPAEGEVVAAGSDVEIAFGAAGGATYACSVDSMEWTPCTSPHTLRGLQPGSHTFAVRATDAAGNIEPVGASRTFTVAAPPSGGGETPRGGGSSTAGGGKTGGSVVVAAGGGGTPSAPSTGSAAVRDSGAPRSSGGAGAVAARPRLLGRVAGVARVDRAGRFTIPKLKAECPAGGACTVSATVSGRIAGSGTRSIAAGRTTAVQLRLTRAALARLVSGRRVTVSVKVTVRGPGGTTARTVKVALRRG